MGCIFSQPNEEAKRRRSYHKQVPQQQPSRKKPTNIATTTTHQGSNGLSPRYANNISTASRDLSKEHTNDESIINEKDDDIQFRRQSFDRNSVLRQSKKRSRKNSTASAGNGSVLVTSPTSRSNGGSVPKTAEKEPSSQHATSVTAMVTSNTPPPSSTPTALSQKMTEDNNPVEHSTASPAAAASGSVSIGVGCVVESEPQQSVEPVVTASPKDEKRSRRAEINGEFSASANVAALLGKKAQRPQQDEAVTASDQVAGGQLQPTTLRAIQARSSASNGLLDMAMIKPATTTINTAEPPRKTSLTINGSSSSNNNHRHKKQRKISAPAAATTSPPRRSSEAIVASSAKQQVEEDDEEDCGRLI